MSYQDIDTIITLPDWGDSDPWAILSMCECLNSGCSEECPAITDADLIFLLSQNQTQSQQTSGSKTPKGEQCQSRDPNNPWRIQRYGDNSPRSDYGYSGWQGHHGVLNQWMKNLFGNVYDENIAPAVLMPNEPHHNMTRTLYRLLTGAGLFNINTASWSQVKNLADDMFTVSDTSSDCRNKYWDWFKTYAKYIICRLIAESATSVLLPPNIQALWDFASPGVSPSEAICNAVAAPRS